MDKLIYQSKDMLWREISIKQTNAIALKTWREDKKQFLDSWLHWPKSSECKIENGKIIILDEDNTPLLTYTLGESK